MLIKLHDKREADRRMTRDDDNDEQVFFDDDNDEQLDGIFFISFIVIFTI